MENNMKGKVDDKATPTTPTNSEFEGGVILGRCATAKMIDMVHVNPMRNETSKRIASCEGKIFDNLSIIVDRSRK
jgi:hypothetical protein